MSAPTFNPATCPITFSLDVAQVDLILRGLGKLPHEEVAQFHNELRAHAINTLQQAEHEHLAAVQAESPSPSPEDQE